MISPVLFLVFNRPDTTRRVFEAIRRAKPPRLYVAADGPRPDREGEIDRCTVVRVIATNVDWPCEVKTLFQDKNIGCKMAVSGAITWFFEHEEQGIILEDDCVVHPDFFKFCDCLLDRYVDDERVSVITGNNFQNGKIRGDASYYFSKYNHCWGWASWKRAWKFYQEDIPFWEEWKTSGSFKEKLQDSAERKYWTRIFDSVSRNEIDSWAYPWTASVWKYGGLTATPNVNLVENIGFNSDATHTHDYASSLVIESDAIGEISHPSKVHRNIEADMTVNEIYVYSSLYSKLKLAVKRCYIYITKY